MRQLTWGHPGRRPTPIGAAASRTVSNELPSDECDGPIDVGRSHLYMGSVGLGWIGNWQKEFGQPIEHIGMQGGGTAWSIESRPGKQRVHAGRSLGIVALG